MNIGIFAIASSVAASFWNVFARMAPWLLSGFFAAGALAVLIPKPFVMRVMGGRTGLAGIARAVLIGIPLPICSCGVLPIAAGLRRHGAGRGATAGFLLATPQTGVDSILATYALLGPVFAICRPVAALVTGVACGIAVDAVAWPDAETERADAGADAPPKTLSSILWQGYIRLLSAIVRPLLAGLFVSALVTVFVPDDFFAGFLGGSDALAMPLMALLGFPMYICSTAAIPVAASLAVKGLSPGAVFVFLMVGPAVNAMSISTIGALIGRRPAAVYSAVIVLGAILCGVGVNAIPHALPELSALAAHAHGVSVFQHVCGALLAVLLFNAWRRSPMRKKSAACR